MLINLLTITLSGVIFNVGVKMKAETKKLIVTVINIVIFIGNAIISFIGNGGDVSTVVAIGGALLTGTTLA